MRRILVAVVVIGAVSVAGTVGEGFSAAVAQDDETADLRTRVAALETAVAELVRPTPTPANEADPTPTARATSPPVPARGDFEIAVRSPTAGAETGEGSGEAGAGTREAPIPLGTEVDAGGGWRVAVLGAEPDGTDEVLAENPFNEPPELGSRYFLIRVSATFAGPGSASILGGLGFGAVGDSAVAYDSGATCGVLPEALPSTEVFEGGTIEGNICFAVADEDVESLVLFSDSYATFDDEDRVYYALRRDRR